MAQRTDKTRSFGGKTEGFADRQEAQKERNHLNAYLKGHKFYAYGYENGRGIKGRRIPRMHPVVEHWR